MEIKAAAKKFREYWNSRSGYEKGEDQQFWNSLLRDVLGAEDIESSIKYQVPVKLKNTTKFLDAWIPSTRVLIEHKTRGVKLVAPQAGHGGMTPYEQAKEYDDARGFDEKARWIVLCNFDEFLVYDCAKPLDEPERITLADLPKEIHRLSFLVDKKVSKVDSKELEISVQAGRIVAKLYDALLKQFGSNTPETLAALNRLCVRLVFCLYAEDADIFPKNALRNLVKSTPVEFLRRQLLRLFQTLDTPIEKRDRYLEAELAVFPYTNGGLFAGASESEIPPLTEEIARLLDGSSNFDWSGISPTIFGALFESTLNPDTRRAGGMVYTSVENIHKVIDPLFMDGLTQRVDELLGVGESNVRLGLQTSTKKKLLALQDEMASLTFLDPACGSGNFLTETYLSLRRLENRIIAALQGGQGEFDLGEGIGAKVSIQQFKGIEINDFAVSVAKTAMWIAESQMHAETCEILHSEPDFLPLKEYDGIVQGNALRMDWGRLELKSRVEVKEKTDNNSIVGLQTSTYDYIMGNPPFVGYSNQSAEQKADMLSIFVDEKGKPYKTAGKLDYVCAWYRKAADYILGTTEYTENTEKKSSVYSVSSVVKNPSTKCAFVSTNSICQGESVAAFWKPLFEKGLEIDFAWRTFRWDNEAQAKAHVHCVIVGFSFNTETQRLKGTEKLLSLGALRLLRSSRFALTQPDACGAGESRGDKEIGSSGETSKKSPNLRNSKSPSNASNNSESLSLCVKKIFDGDKVIEAEHINGYLMDGPDVWVESRTKPICDVPVMTTGNRPADGGHLIIEREDYGRFQKCEPEALAYIKKFIGSAEFINNKPRYCLWLKNVSPAVLRKMPLVMQRIEACKADRLAAPDPGRRKLADTPTLFRETNNPHSAVVVPSVSSERREYVPMGLIDDETIASNLVFLIPSATLYHFGILTSSVHMAWMRTVCGRLKSDYRYSANIVYNNFPWPEVENVANVQVLPITNANCQLGNGECGTENWKLENGTGNIGNTGNIKKTPNLQNSQSPSNESNKVSSAPLRLCVKNNSVCSVSSVVKNITQTAQSILDARSLYPDSSLADLYDPLTMPPELRKAHAANDRAVLVAYGLAPDTAESEIVAHLMKLYQNAQ